MSNRTINELKNELDAAECELDNLLNDGYSPNSNCVIDIEAAIFYLKSEIKHKQSNPNFKFASNQHF